MSLLQQIKKTSILVLVSSFWVLSFANAYQTSAIEFERGEERVLFVGYIHYSNQDYFDINHDIMEDWIKNSPGQTVILTELMTCQSSTIGVASETEILASDLLMMTSSPELNEDFLNNKTREVDCILDIDNKNYRPSYIVNRNTDACSGDYGVCQWTIDYPQGHGITERSGDLQIDQLSFADQIIGSLAYRSEQHFYSDSAVETWSPIFRSFILDKRDKNLVNQALIEIEKGASKVILPWGNAHGEGVYKNLIERGFRATNQIMVDVPET